MCYACVYVWLLDPLNYTYTTHVFYANIIMHRVRAHGVLILMEDDFCERIAERETQGLLSRRRCRKCRVQKYNMGVSVKI